jgi:hypothetical protein
LDYHVVVKGKTIRREFKFIDDKKYQKIKNNVLYKEKIYGITDYITKLKIDIE